MPGWYWGRMLSADQEWIEELDGELPIPASNPLYVLPYILSRSAIQSMLAFPGLLALEALGVETLYASGMRPRELLELSPTSLLPQARVQVSGRVVEVGDKVARGLAQLSGPRLFPWSEAARTGGRPAQISKN